MAEEVKLQPNKSKKKNDRFFDYSLLFACIFTILFGFVLMYSASSYTGTSGYNDSLYFLKRQLIATALGVVGFIVVMLIDYRIFLKWADIIYWGSLASLLLVLTPLGKSSHGATRWVNLGFTQFQPAELVKIAIIIVVAAMISRCKTTSLKNPITCWKILARPMLAAILLYGLTSNMSSAIIVFLIGFCMLAIAGACKKFYKQFAIFALAGSVLAGLFLMITGGGFRLERIMVWLKPEQYSQKGGYQVLQGLYAIASGGLFGKGLGNSAQKLGSLPESTNDMIFSIICEELGLFGAIFVIAIFVFIIYRMKTIANHVPKKEMFGSMIVTGVTLHIAIQVVMNIAVVTNSMPNTGVSLPFISYGGTSVAFLMAEVGLVFSVSKSIGRDR